RIPTYSHPRRIKASNTSSGASETKSIIGVHRRKSGINSKHPGNHAVPVPAAVQGTRNIGTSRTPETTEIPTRKARLARPIGAGLCQVCPIRDPFVHIAHHVECAPARLAIRARTRVYGAARGDIAVGGTVIRPWIRCARSRVL